MPFKSKAQRRKFAELLVTGKITPEAYERWNVETGSAELPERVNPKDKKDRKKGAKEAAKKSATKAAKKTSKKTTKKASTKAKRKTTKATKKAKTER